MLVSVDDAAAWDVLVLVKETAARGGSSVPNVPVSVADTTTQDVVAGGVEGRGVPPALGRALGEAAEVGGSDGAGFRGSPAGDASESTSFPVFAAAARERGFV